MQYARINALLQALNPETQQLIQSLSTLEHFPKGSMLLREGERSRKSFHIQEGIVRRFSTGEGQITTSEFYFSDDLAFSFSSYVFQRPSREWLECLTPVTAMVANLSELEAAKQEHPQLLELDLRLTERYTLWQEERLLDFRTLSARQRYEKLLQQAPQLFQQVQLTHIASYLGMSLATLSRLRARQSPSPVGA
jgi:CRP-like cAMP-binding protein